MAENTIELQASMTKRVISGSSSKYHMVLVGVLSILFGLGVLVPSSEKYLALIPANTAIIAFRPWNLFTAAYFETNILMGLLNTSVALIIGRMLERKWGLQFLKLMVIVNSISMFIIFIIMVFFYASTAKESFIFSPVCGFSAANAAFGVALKQLAPNQNCISSINKLKFKDIPMLVVGGSVVCFVLGLTQMKDLLLVVLGTYFGWLYLRYFMKYPNTSGTGDLSEEFAFKMLFPTPIRPIGAMFGNLTFWSCELCGFCKVVDPIQLVEKKEELNTIPDVPAVSDVERQTAERRRALAVKAINDRIEQLKKAKAAARAAGETSQEANNTNETGDTVVNIKEKVSKD
ncbi:hypothetical protein AAMO2058_000603200 [Amorphochlora amoebiformis]|uniref:Peptidase S54 rhomboid domain-containing protein n=1 Tax=Amorphochlora amoebiformis TaxID=1561963 RepID=A0A7S0GVN7_9EUKA|mmetsp:Transcript_22613/g.35499  ORF Transcript_22613/g.35499 Transcript_22613/m.35499 type:complete len:346 (+) Transcript_22613:38-1075(+)